MNAGGSLSLFALVSRQLQGADFRHRQKLVQMVKGFKLAQDSDERGELSSAGLQCLDDIERHGRRIGHLTLGTIPA